MATAIQNHRESNIELLRILCMFFLIIHHCVVHGGALNIVSSNNLYIAWAFLPIGKMCFVAFVAISAWFLVDKGFKAERFLKIWLQVLFYSVTFAVVAYLFGAEMTIRNWFSTLFPIAGNSHGFAAAYLAFFLLLPFLYKVGKNITKNQLLFLLVALFYFQIMTSGIGFVSQYYQKLSSELQLFIFIYYIMLYFKRFPIKLFEKKLFNCIIILSCWSILFVMNYLRITSNNIFIELFFSMNADESGILYILSGCSLFFLFKSIKMPSVGIINNVAKTTFGILLIHDHNFFRYILWPTILSVQTWHYSNYFLIKLIIIGILIFSVCAFIDYLRRIFLEQPIFKLDLVKRVCVKFDRIFEETSKENT